MNKKFSYERYQRQVLLKELGEEGQQKLLDAKVLVVGAGGLGCPILQYLTAAGIGTIGIVDDDIVSIHNLHRQPLYGPDDVGVSKVVVATAVLHRQNPDVSFEVINERLTSGNALDILNRFDIIVDGTDNFATRYLVNDACVLLGKPLVFGAVLQFEGQVAVFDPNIGKEAANYRDLFPDPPKEDEVPNCADAGVIGVLPGIIGTLMASETIKWITGIGTPLISRMLTYNALQNQFYEFRITAQAGTRSKIPADAECFSNTDYVWLCAATETVPQIDIHTFEQLRRTTDIDIIDVREPGEKPEISAFQHRKRPLSLLSGLESLPGRDTIVVFCQSGKRSNQAVARLMNYWGDGKKIFSLTGGIEAWTKHQMTKTP